MKKEGLKLTDIQTFLYSIKACWVKRFLNKDNKGLWKCFFDSPLQNVGADFIFECNMSSADIKITYFKNQFLKDVLYAWLKVSSDFEKANDVRKHIIWNNSDINTEEKTLFMKHWFDIGIRYIEQLYDFRNNKLFSFNEAKTIFGVNSAQFLNYFKLTKSIPRKYFTILNPEIITRGRKETLLDKLVKSKNPNPVLYHIQIQSANEESITSEHN